MKTELQLLQAAVTGLGVSLVAVVLMAVVHTPLALAGTILLVAFSAWRQSSRLGVELA